MDKYGINIDLSLDCDFEEGEHYSIDVKFDDTNGIAALARFDGNNLNDVLEKAFTDIATHVQEGVQDEEEEDDFNQALKDEIESLKIDNYVLKQRLAKLQNANVERRKKYVRCNHPSFADLFYW